jgi:hypothetical protein
MTFPVRNDHTVWLVYLLEKAGFTSWKRLALPALNRRHHADFNKHILDIYGSR